MGTFSAGIRLRPDKNPDFNFPEDAFDFHPGDAATDWCTRVHVRVAGRAHSRAATAHARVYVHVFKGGTN